MPAQRAQQAFGLPRIEPRLGSGRGGVWAGPGRGLGRGGAGSTRVPGRVAEAEAAAARWLHSGRAMPAARVEYIAPWWVVWLHSVPRFGLRLQPVDSTFSPRDESYQEVSARQT